MQTHTERVQKKKTRKRKTKRKDRKQKGKDGKQNWERETPQVTCSAMMKIREKNAMPCRSSLSFFVRRHRSGNKYRLSIPPSPDFVSPS